MYEIDGSDDEHLETIREKLGHIYDENAEEMFKKEKLRNEKILSEFLNKSQQTALSKTSNISSKQSKPEANSSSESIGSASQAGGFANLSKLTNIFQKEVRYEVLINKYYPLTFFVCLSGWHMVG